MAKQPKPKKPKGRKDKKRTTKGFEHKAAQQSANQALKNICWVSMQVPDSDDEVTAYVDFAKMRIIPWDDRALQTREVMNAFPFDWTCWWILEMTTSIQTFYKFAQLSIPGRRKLRDILRPVAAKGQEVTEQERLDCIAARGAIFTTSDHQFTDQQLDQLFTLVRKHGTPVGEIKQVA